MPLRRLLSLAACLATAFASLAHADTFSSVVVYGDSLSDNGNLYKLTGQPTSPPYFQGRFSNGPVAVEQLALKLNAPLYDFAFGGATSGLGNEGDGGTQMSFGKYGLPGMFAELKLPASAALLASPLTASSLFVVWGGANDYLINGSPTVAAEDIDAIVASLQAAGAKHILVPGVPDLGLTPDYHGSAAATAYSQQVDTLLKASLPPGATYVDTDGLLHAIVANPSAYGLTNITTPCLNTTTDTVCSNPDQYLFWDGFHPTTAVDALVASEFINAATPTPEPSSILLLSSGVAGLTTLLRRRRGRQ